jgi:hypothetical protein
VITQMVPAAPGWYVTWPNDAEPLVGWALTDGHVVGLVARKDEVVTVHEAAGHVSIAHNPDALPFEYTWRPVR